MGTFQHVLRGVKSNQKPRNWCFFDVEAKITRDKDKVETHTCKLGWSCYLRDATNDKTNREVWFCFFDAMGFWEQLLKVCEPDRKLVVIGYNVGYDFRLVDGFRCLAELGYKQERLYCKSHVVIMSFVKGKHNVTVLDAMNYFNGKLESWGDMLGVPKGKIDFNTASNEKLLKYCKQDVLILKLLFLKWMEFVETNNFGHFCVTRASQAMVAYRKKFMKRNIYIHADIDATKLERESYYGGRTECFYIGNPPFKQFWKVDINSMYPHIMKTYPVPYNLRGVRLDVPVNTARKLSDEKGLIALVDIDTPIPAFPLKYKDKICFPVGTFRTTLAGAELNAAFSYGVVKKVYAMAVYDIAIRFKGYVEEMYSLRQRYKKEGNIIFEQMVKYLMNSLYGKFGQYSETWKECPEVGDLPEGEHILINLETNTQYRVISIAGQIWKATNKTESIDSFPAIASFITAAARIHLWNLMLKAGRKNVFYTDTDSLFLNLEGYKRLTDELDNNELGKLKLEYQTKSLLIRCPKDYETDVEQHVKGITSKAVKINDCTFEQTQWEGLRGAIAKGRTNCVVLTPTVKVLKRNYDKGIVLESGYVKPYSLSD